MLEERLEQVREIDGELAYGKMRRALEKASQEKASQEKARQARQVERARQVESARLERAMQEDGKAKQGPPWAGTRGAGAGTLAPAAERRWGSTGLDLQGRKRIE